MMVSVPHVMPLTAGGAPIDIANPAALCRSCDSVGPASMTCPSARYSAVMNPLHDSGVVALALFSHDVGYIGALHRLG